MTMGAASGPGTLQVDLEVPRHVNAEGVPQEIVDVPVQTVSLGGGGVHHVDLAVTPRVVAAAHSGLANFELLAHFGRSVATSTASLPVTGGTGAVGLVARSPGGSQTVTFSPFHTQALLQTVSPSQGYVPRSCHWFAYGPWHETSNRIGQMQDSSGAGSAVSWVYRTTADSTFGVGVSNSSPTGGYSASGSLTVTNSIGTSSGFSEGPGFNGYVDSNFYRQTYQSNMYFGHPLCGDRWMTRFVSAVGDSYPGPYSPPRDPYGTCWSDPYGKAKVPPKTGVFSADRGRATNYGGAANIFGLSVNGQTGYTNNIHIDYANHSGLWEYVCGNGYMSNPPILWSNNSAGL